VEVSGARGVAWPFDVGCLGSAPSAPAGRADRLARAPPGRRCPVAHVRRPDQRRLRLPARAGDRAARRWPRSGWCSA